MTLPIVRIALCLALMPVWARAADPTADQKKIDELTAQVEALKAENAALKQKLDALEKSAGAKPQPVYELGPDAKLGAYKHKTPTGWNPTPPKGKEVGMFYRSPDKVGLIFVVVQPKGAAPPEMQPKYAQQMVQKLKDDFTRSKTEIIEPPAAQPDPRFFLKIHERIRVNTNQTADQTHYYVMPGKDLVQLTVITTSDDPAQISSIRRLAEDMLLSFKVDK